MDFSNSNITKILKGSIQNRFNDFSPQDFEDFIANVFKDKGYNVQQTPYTADFGVDLIVETDNSKCAVQIKRYAKENKVSVSEINQINGAKSFYDCSTAMLITTSSLSTNAKETANKLGVMVWNWEDLIKVFKDLYWDGKDFYQFYDKQYDTLAGANDIKFEVYNVAFNLQTEHYGTFTGIDLKVSNLSNENIRFSIKDRPQFVNSNMDQISSLEDPELEKKFVVYSGCSIKIKVYFPAKDLPSIKAHERLIIEVLDHEKASTEIYHIRLEKNYDSIYREVGHGVSRKTDQYYDESESSTIVEQGKGFWSTTGEVMTGLGKALLIAIGAIVAAFIWIMSVLLNDKK